ncbi:MAG TPA: 6-bladed beta-propeller [bacterium]|nr:6-bladed beta-propeller [bacterium]
MSPFRALPLAALMLGPLGAAVSASAAPAFVLEWGGNGTGPGQFIRPFGLDLDDVGTLYVVDILGGRLQTFDASGTRLGGWGPFGSPSDVAVDDAADVVYVTDYLGHVLLRFRRDGTPLGGWGQLGSGTDDFRNPGGVTVDAQGIVYVSDTFNHRIKKIAADGQVLDIWGGPDAGSGAGQFDRPFGIAIDGSGDVYVADNQNHRVQKLTSDGQPILEWGSFGTGGGEFDWAFDVAVGPAGDRVWVVDRNNDRVEEFTPDGTFLSSWGQGGRGPGEFAAPTDVIVAADGSVFVADYANDRIQKFRDSAVGIGGALRDASWGIVKGGYRSPAGPGR